ncbi:MAG TPA: hypothetical protein VGM56_20310 [Byssovorax sp.]|jgi:hypothetical protein
MSSHETTEGVDDMVAASAQPMLLRVRSGKTAAKVLAFGFGGATLLIGVGNLVAGWGSVSPLGLLVGYALAATPFVLLGAIVAACKQELWLVPDLGALRLLTFRPWLRAPRVEQASVTDYAGVRAELAPDQEGGGALVSLVTAGGENVELRQFGDLGEASAFASELAARSGLWLRGDAPAPELPEARA